eukprot:jgi/Botrbrau1/21916/Bobra.0249s0042.1
MTFAGRLRCSVRTRWRRISHLLWQCLIYIQVFLLRVAVKKGFPSQTKPTPALRAQEAIKLPCPHCGKTGHNVDSCWVLHSETKKLKTKKATCEVWLWGVTVTPTRYPSSSRDL